MNEAGNVAVLTAAALSVVAMVSAAAIDYSRNLYTKTVLDSSLDTAVISVARDLKLKKINQAQLLSRAREYFASNFDNANHDGEVTGFNVKFKGNEVHITLNAEVTEPNIFGSVLGKPVTVIKSTAEATYAFQSVEVALVLDVTGSMAQSGRITALRSAASDLVDVLFGPDLGENVRVSLVPYSQGVNAGVYASAATGGTSTSCATERTGLQAATDASYATEPVLAGSSRCPAPGLVPLTKDTVALHAAIDALAPLGSTAGQTGIAWGWYTLSPSWASLWPEASRPEDYDTSGAARLKVAVVMTDGEFNTAYYGVPGAATENTGAAADSQARAKLLCTAIKAKGIRLYTVSFMAGSTAEKLLEGCATDKKSTYFKAQNASDLNAAFQKIGEDVSSFYLSH